ncbi:unnamed protein product [Rhizophagus irregularis]|nr:unnamed protein product [Rhizophagus irregularis]
MEDIERRVFIGHHLWTSKVPDSGHERYRLLGQAEPQLGFPQGISSQAESTPSVWLGLNNTTPDIQRATKL